MEFHEQTGQNIEKNAMDVENIVTSPIMDNREIETSSSNTETEGKYIESPTGRNSLVISDTEKFKKP